MVERTEGVHPIELTRVKAFLLACEEKMALVDTGRSDEDAEEVIRHIKQLGRDPTEVELCVLTHRHRDHLGGLRKLKRVCGFRVAAHAGDAGEIQRQTGIEVDEELADRQVLPYCGGVEVVHVPGHTGGNICLYLPEKAALITGDTLFAREGKLSPPPEEYCEDPEMARRELKRLLDLEFETLLVSHGKDFYKGGKQTLQSMLDELAN